MGRFRGCSAVVCYNDQIAFDFVEILAKEGIHVPEHISVVSIDDSELTVLGDVALTSVPHPMDRLGEKAAINLLQMIGNPAFDATYEFDAQVVVRDSVKTLEPEEA